MDQQRRVRVRSCVSCRTTSDKSQLLRIVRTPEGEVRIDASGKMAGRGAYLCCAKECLAQAIKHNKLGRALRCAVPERLLDELRNTVVRDDV